MIELYNRDGIGKRTIVSSGELYGYQWYIVSYGSHPCAYVRSDIPEKVQDEIEVHGGITFSGKAFDEFTIKGKYIGWDYNHYDDYRCEDTRKNFVKIIEELPAADVEEVVQCKDCVHFYPFVNNPKFGECMVYVCDLEDPAIMEETGFCSDGERKDDQQCK